MNRLESPSTTVVKSHSTAPQPGAAVDVAPHLAPLPDDEWALWRWVGLRGAGFPVDRVLRLAAPESAAAADQVIDAEDRFAQAATASFAEAFAAGRAAISAELREVGATGAFREAVLWQNRQALHTALEPLLRKPAEIRNKKVRQHEELVARYLQRYCTKNDTIGFFGPVGWARIVDSGKAVDARPGGGLTSLRGVYFEGWPIDALADVIAADARTRRWLPPNPSPCARLHRGMLHLPVAGALPLTSEELTVWNACDGRRSATDVARRVLAVSPSAFSTDSQVFEVLERLRAKGALDWTIDIPVQANPERRLRRVIESLGDVELREAWLRRLDDLDAARRAVAAANGDEALDRSLGDLEEVFVRATGAAPTRSAGKTYAARTLVYQDCRRDLDVDLGPELLEALGPPLSLLLASARWFTFTVANVYRSALTRIYEALSAEPGGTVDAVSFWGKAQGLLFGTRDRPLDAVLADFQRRWAAVLRLPPGARRVQYASGDLRPRVRDVFHVPGPGWTGACYHSPDLMLAARDVAAINRGEYEVVLGELHMAMNSLSSALFLEQHPSRDALSRAVEFDLPRGRVLPVVPKYWPKRTVRTDPALFARTDVRLEFAPGARAGDELPVVRLGSLVVARGPNGAVVRTPDRRLEFDVVDFFGDMLMGMLADRFRILGDEPHTPRVRVDRFVLCRQTWRLPAAHIAFAWEEDEPRRFLAGRRWARRLGLPRFVFVKTPAEPKPFYVDLVSPIYIELFGKAVRRSQEAASDAAIVVSEMLPAPDHAWVPDAAGRRYTSELRMVAVDLAGRR